MTSEFFRFVFVEHNITIMYYTAVLAHHCVLMFTPGVANTSLTGRKESEEKKMKRKLHQDEYIRFYIFLFRRIQYDGRYNIVSRTLLHGAL